MRSGQLLIFIALLLLAFSPNMLGAANIEISPQQGVVGTEVAVSGSGFGALKQIRVDFGATQSIATTTASVGGNFVVIFPVDLQPGGVTTVTATDSVSSDSEDFTILPQITKIVPEIGRVGEVVNLEGNGFPANVQLTVDFGSAIGIANAASIANGSFVLSFTVNDQPPGEKIVKVRNGTSEATGTFMLSQVIRTSTFAFFKSSNTTLNGQPVPVGSMITAKDPDGVVCGEFIVKEAGKYGYMSVYGDEPATPNVDEGAQTGNIIKFFINGIPATITNGVEPKWQDRKKLVVDLAAGKIIGDVTKNGVITGMDAARILQHLTGLIQIPAEDLEIADVNDDGNITPEDAGLILKYVAGLIQNFSAGP